MPPKEFDFSQGSPIETPESIQPTSTLGKVGEFVAPSTMGVISKLREGESPSGRQYLGAGLELGSVFLPVGATARALGLVGKVGIRSLQALTAMQKLKQTAKISGAVTGIAGGMFGAGQELADEESSTKEVIGGAATGAITAGIGGMLIVPTVSLGIMGAKGLANLTSSAFRQWIGRTKLPQIAEEAVEHLTDSYDLSFNQERPQITKALQKIWIRGRITGGPTDERGLFKELAQNGYVPRFDGRIARMFHIVEDLNERISSGMNEIKDFLKPVKKTISIEKFKARVEVMLRDDIGIDLGQALRESQTLFKAIKIKYGGKLSAEVINDIRIELNKKTKAYAKEVFAEDTKDIIANVSREVLDEMVPSQIVRRMNREIAQLGRMRNVANVLDGKPIAHGEYVDTLGRFTGVVGSGMIGATLGASLGSLPIAGGGLVIAGLTAQIGSRFAANMIRKFRFNPEIQKVIVRSIAQDITLLEKIIQKATPEDAELIKKTVKMILKQ